MKSIACAMLVVVSVSASAAMRSDVEEALDGVDPVLLVQGKEVSGKPEFKAVHAGFEYLFASAATKATFEANPAQYAIQLGGLCARMGKATGGRPSDYLVHDGKIYIFGSDECHRRFAAEPRKYLPKDAAPFTGTAKAIEEGRAIVERVVNAVGGAARLDAITTYVETASAVQRRPAGPVPMTVRTMWRFPDAVRMERTVTMADRSITSAALMTASGMWFLAQGRAYPILEAGRPSLQLDYGRQLVPLLRGRRAPGFKAVSLGRQTVEGTPAERVRIVNGPVDLILLVDPGTGRARGVTFQDRNGEGEVGEYTVLFSGYQTVDGLTLPLAERATFNGAPDEALSRRLDSAAINTPLDPSLFQAGQPGRQ